MRLKFLLIFILLIVVVGCVKKEEVENKSKTSEQKERPAITQTSSRINIVAVSITSSSPSFKAGERVTLYPVIKNMGESVNNVEVVLYANGNKINTFNFDFKAGETKGPLYQWYPNEEGEYELKLVVDPENKIAEPKEDNEAKTIVVIR
ncbi:MAG: CARDB domain-containing protein [Candidatus Woesearchaeota archaeon]